jgi:hypothetical protein
LPTRTAPRHSECGYSVHSRLRVLHDDPNSPAKSIN